ncbi:hypothetical protein [Bradyrhizobium sp. USDA 3315]
MDAMTSWVTDVAILSHRPMMYEESRRLPPGTGRNFVDKQAEIAIEFDRRWMLRPLRQDGIRPAFVCAYRFCSSDTRRQLLLPPYLAHMTFTDV